MIYKILKEKLISISTSSILLIALFFAFNFPLRGLQNLFRYRYWGDIQWMINQNIHILHFFNIRLDVTGFILPLGVAIPLTVISYLKFSHPSRKATGLFLLFIVISDILPYFFRSLQSIQAGIGASASISTIVVVYTFAAYCIEGGFYKFLNFISYPLGFTIGAMGDISSTPIINYLGGGIFGGLGFLDGDFMLPLLSVAMIFAARKVFEWDKATLTDKKIKSKN